MEIRHWWKKAGITVSTFFWDLCLNVGIVFQISLSAQEDRPNECTAVGVSDEGDMYLLICLLKKKEKDVLRDLWLLQTNQDLTPECPWYVVFV